MKTYALAWLVCSFLCYKTVAQYLHFQSYTSAQGLSQNSVYSIAQTRDQFMWFGTQDGLNRFDGKNFIVINPAIKNKDKSNNHEARFSKMITALFADSDDWLWVGTTFEILLFDRYINSFVLPSDIYKGFKMPAGSWVTKIKEDSKNNIWILTQKDGLFCYSKSQKAMLSLVWPADNVPKRIIAFDNDEQGKIWIAGENQVYQSEGEHISVVNLQNGFLRSNEIITEMAIIHNEPWLILNTSKIVLVHHENNKSWILKDFSKEFQGGKYLSDARLIHQSDDNTVWIGSRSDGLIRVNLLTKTFDNAGAAETIHSLKSQFILSFFTSGQKITWIGLSGGGIAKFDAQKIQFNLWRNEAINGHPMPDNMFFSVFSENDKDFYLGTLSGGLLHINILSRKYTYYKPSLAAKNLTDLNNIYEIIQGESNLLWMATWGGLCSFNKQTFKFTQYADDHDEQTKKLCAIIKLKKLNKILVGGYEGGLRLFDLSTHKWEKCRDAKGLLDSSLFKLRVRHMKEMDNGDIYMSTEALSLVCYNYITGKFTFFKQFQQLSGASRYFYKDSLWLWVATDDGLIQAYVSNHKIKKIWTTENGLPNNYIYAVLPDNYGRLWISSNGGLAMLDEKNGICEKFTEDDGLQSMEFNTASCYKDRKGDIWFGGINGLNMVDPHLSAPNNYSPVPHVIAISVMNVLYQTDTATPYLHNITLPFSKNFISFQFQCPNFSQSENVVYAYQMLGVDTGWVSSGTNNQARYTQLKPGHYRFIVRSANANYVWSADSSAIDIYIVPPWYNTTWFYILLAAVIIFICWLVVSQRFQNVRYKAAVNQKILETEMAALKAQMNPHFMFNCINSIDAFIQSNDKYNATLYLNKFARLIRNILDSSKQNLVTFSKDIETLKLYIELEELRSENKFTTQLHIDDELMSSDYKVPPLIIQPFVENAIIHGLRSKEGNDGKLVVEIFKTESHIQYRVTDNGVGRKITGQKVSGKEKSYGIEMSTERIRLFNGEEKASVFITDLYDNDIAIGTQVLVNLNMM